MTQPTTHEHRRAAILEWARAFGPGLAAPGAPAELAARRDAAWDAYERAEAAGWIMDFATDAAQRS